MDPRQRFLTGLSAAFGIALAAASFALPAQISERDLLPMSEAFRLEVSRPKAEQVRVSWTIAEGYYLYRERFRFDAAPAKIRDGFSLPPGILKQDPFFGETQIYRHHITFELPLDNSAATMDRISLKVVSQGCADLGICFPPEARTADLSVGETAIPKAGDPFAPVGGEPPADLLLPVSPPRSNL